MCADRATSSASMAREVEIPAGGVILRGRFTPAEDTGTVVFAHGSGSSGHSPRNVQVADALAERRFGTLLFDLLIESEAGSRELVFDIPLLGGRLLAATRWLKAQPESERRAVGYFGASTGAAAALVAAAEAPELVAAVVSRGGRPDLAGESLERVTAPTLLIVGGEDVNVLEMNSEAQRNLRCESELAIVPGATHLFEEPGTLEAVTDHAASWFGRHLARAAA
jgi:putative phosphoribosyl transferase